MIGDLLQRPRRLRSSPKLRDMLGETQLSLRNLVQPYFLENRVKDKEPIKNFEGVYRWSIDSLSKEIEIKIDQGLSSFLLFASAEQKDEKGSEAYSKNSLMVTALKTLRQRFGRNIFLFSDVCLCPYTDHGHCGVLENHSVENDASVELLAQMAVLHAQAGVDMVAPSDMMDGRIGAIRRALDQQGLSETGILSYSAKYKSNYYGPFREALDSSPQKGDRSSYQMDYRNSKEALRELSLDIEEGADLVMVKPALAYLDILSLYSEHSSVPVAAYSVSGEYQMIKLAAQAGIAEEQALALENLTAIRRAGAQLIFTYFASAIAERGWWR